MNSTTESFSTGINQNEMDRSNADGFLLVENFIAVADGCRRASESTYFSLDRDEIKTGDLIAGPEFPVAWPRTAQDLPKSPVKPGPKTGFGFSQ
jgi:hypothetical protein